METFDLILSLELIRAYVDAEALYLYFDRLCNLREKKMITSVEFDEIKDAVQAKLAALRQIKESINGRIE